MEKKRTVIFLIILILAVIFNYHSVNAALGLTPGVIETDFQPSAKFMVNFNVLSAEAEQKLEVYAAGDLSKYVRFDKTNLTGQEGFTAYIDLPEKAEKPGKNILYIRVREVLGPESGIGTRLEIGAAIVIKVPYPGQYAEISSFSVNDANSKEPISFNIDVANRGNEEIFATANLKVYSNRKKIDDFNLGGKFINHTTSYTFTKIAEKGYEAGIYNATATVDYGKIIISQKEFRVGSLFVNITNWSSEFIKGKINEFKIDIESRWNNDISNVYAEVNVINITGDRVDSFKTPSITLSRWQKTKLNGFFNAVDLPEGKYKADITIFYEDKTTNRIVDVKVIIPGEKKKIPVVAIILIASGIVIVLLIGIIFYLVKKIKGNRKKKSGQK